MYLCSSVEVRERQSHLFVEVEFALVEDERGSASSGTSRSSRVVRNERRLHQHRLHQRWVRLYSTQTSLKADILKVFA